MINYLFTLMGTVTSTAALGTLNMVASALGQNLLWGRICDRRKIRTTLIVAGETIAAFAYIIVFLVHTSMINIGTPYLAGLTIIFGLSILEFFWSMSDVGWAALLTDVTTAGNRGKVIGAMNFIASLGRMVGILFAGFLYAEGEGFRSGRIFYIVTALLLVGAGLMALTSRSMKKKQEASQRPNTEEPCADSKEPKPDPQNQKNVHVLPNVLSNHHPRSSLHQPDLPSFLEPARRAQLQRLPDESSSFSVDRRGNDSESGRWKTLRQVWKNQNPSNGIMLRDGHALAVSPRFQRAIDGDHLRTKRRVLLDYPDSRACFCRRPHP